MKKLMCLLLTVCALTVLTACGCDDGRDTDLVFVNDSNAVIMAVLADFADQGSVVQHTDSSPLKRGETFGFEAGEYPVTVMVYDRAVESFGETELAQFIITSAPPEGERWYVTARDAENGGLTLSAGTQWPEGA